MEKETRKIWVTKYALTKGVFSADAELSSEYLQMAVVEGDIRLGTCRSCYHGSDWHLTRSCALEQAERMRARKLESLRKQIAKLEALKFDD